MTGAKAHAMSFLRHASLDHDFSQKFKVSDLHVSGYFFWGLRGQEFQDIFQGTR